MIYMYLLYVFFLAFEAKTWNIFWNYLIFVLYENAGILGNTILSLHSQFGYQFDCYIISIFISSE